MKVDFSISWVRTDFERPTYMNDDFYNHILRRARPVRAVYDPNGYLMSDINYIGVMRDGGRHNEQKDAMAQQLKITVTPLKKKKKKKTKKIITGTIGNSLLYIPTTRIIRKILILL